MRHVSAVDFVRAHTSVRHAPYTPEVRLHLADDSLAVWEATENAMQRGELPPPFWAFVWAGGQALARYLLDTDAARGRMVVDVATGSGLVAVAAALTGAAHVTAYDVDDVAVTAVQMNARLNGVTVDAVAGGVSAATATAGTLVTVGDAFYDATIAAAMLPALTAFADAGAEVLVGDPHRAYLPTDRLEVLAEYEVDVETDLEDAPVKPAVVARLSPPAYSCR